MRRSMALTVTIRGLEWGSGIVMLWRLTEGEFGHVFGEAEASLRRRRGSAAWRATWAPRGRPGPELSASSEALEPYSSWFACNPKHLGFPLTQTPILLSPNHYRAHSLSCNGRLSCDSRYCRDLGGSAKCSTRPEVMQTSVIRLMAAVARWSVEGSMEVRKAQTPQSKGRSIKYRNRP